MPALGAPELIIILVIIVLIFGVGKLPEVGSALGKGLKEFRTATDDKDKEEAAAREEAAASAPPPPAAVEAPRPSPAIEAPRPQTVSPATIVPTEAARGHVAHVVQSGDTLDVVAQRYGVSVESLMQANGYGQRDRVLYAGDSIQVPKSTTNA